LGKLYTINEVAEYLKVTRLAVYRWIRAGKLKGIQLAGKEWRVEDGAAMVSIFFLQSQRLRSLSIPIS
jgi:excisionase family DNA binding protein